jgi:hypothetical protein
MSEITSRGLQTRGITNLTPTIIEANYGAFYDAFNRITFVNYIKQKHIEHELPGIDETFSRVRRERQARREPRPRCAENEILCRGAGLTVAGIKSHKRPIKFARWLHSPGSSTKSEAIPLTTASLPPRGTAEGDCRGGLPRGTAKSMLRSLTLTRPIGPTKIRVFVGICYEHQ